MRAWSRDAPDSEPCTRNSDTQANRSLGGPRVRAVKADQSTHARVRESARRDMSSSPCTALNTIKRQPVGRSRSRSADITPYDEHDRSRSGSVDLEPKDRQGRMRAWDDDDVCPAVKKTTIVITCEHIGDKVKCTTISGNEVGEFKIPERENPYETWLGSAVSECHQPGVGELCLVRRDGTIIWREGDGRTPMSTQKESSASSRSGRFTGRERFLEGHDDRVGGCFAEYYTPRRRLF